jgi:FkbM family methyltransferase
MTTDLPDTTEPAATNAAYDPPAWMRAEVADYDVEMYPPPAVILDIGANVGAYTQRCARKYPAATIVAYEPGRESAEAFRENCASLKNIVFHQRAVRKFTGQDLLLKGNLDATRSFHDLGRQSRDGSYFVDCISAETLPKADLVKIDTEGCELEILEKLDISAARAVVCEWHRVGDRETIKQQLHSRGFVVLNEEQQDDTSGILKFIRPSHIAKPFKLFIGLPVYAGAPVFFTQCLLALQRQWPFPDKPQLEIAQGDGVARSRNVLTESFMRSDCTHMLQIDSDLVWSVQHILRLLSHDVPVVGGLYPKKQDGPNEWVLNVLPSPQPEPTAAGLQAVRYVGTGMILVKREVFEQMRERYPESRYREDYGSRQMGFEYWPMGVYRPNPNDEGRYLSEDWYFCQRWLDMGGAVYADLQVMLRHLGTVSFPLISQESAMMNVRDSADTVVKQTTLANEQV